MSTTPPPRPRPACQVFDVVGYRSRPGADVRARESWLSEQVRCSEEARVGTSGVAMSAAKELVEAARAEVRAAVSESAAVARIANPSLGAQPAAPLMHTFQHSQPLLHKVASLPSLPAPHERGLPPPLSSAVAMEASRHQSHGHDPQQASPQASAATRSSSLASLASSSIPTRGPAGLSGGACAGSSMKGSSMGLWHHPAPASSSSSSLYRRPHQPLLDRLYVPPPPPERKAAVAASGTLGGFNRSTGHVTALGVQSVPRKVLQGSSSDGSLT